MVVVRTIANREVWWVLGGEGEGPGTYNGTMGEGREVGVGDETARASNICRPWPTAHVHIIFYNLYYRYHERLAHRSSLSSFSIFLFSLVVEAINNRQFKNSTVRNADHPPLMHA